METGFQDLSDARLCNENEIDNAIYAVICAAFSEQDELSMRRAIRARLPGEPTSLELIDAVVEELALRGRLRYEEQRRAYAGHVLAAFFDLPAADRADVSLMPDC